MKRLYVPFILILFISSLCLGQEDVNIEFNFDLNDQVVSEFGPHIAGSWQDWNASTDVMTDDDGDGIFSYVASFTPGDTVYYKFINGNSWDDPHDQMLENEPCVADNIDEYADNRMFIIPEVAFEIPPTCMNSCEPCNLEPPQGNHSLSFDGEDDYVDFPNPTFYNVLDAITIAAWFKTNTLGIEQTIVSKFDNSNESYLLGINPENRVYFLISINGTRYFAIANELTITTDDWINIFATYDGNVMKVFINGQLWASEYISGSIDQTNIPLNIGRTRPSQNNYSSYRFNGKIDNLAILNYALSDQEIENNFNSYEDLEFFQWNTGLIGHFNFNSGQGSTLVDYSTSGNNGTIYGATWSDDVPSIVPTSTANITFQADMSFLVEQGWDDNIHTLELRGDFNQWGPGESISNNETGLYIITREITAEINSMIQWKFKAEPGDMFLNDGWDDIPNREFEFTGEDIIFEPTEPSISFMPEPVASISVGTVDGMENMTVSVPIYIELLDYSASSIQLNFSGFQPYMDFIDILTFGSMAGEASWDFEFNSNEDMLLTLTYGASELSGSGRLFELLFEINEDIETSFIPISVDYVQIDELEIDIELNHGGVEIITLWGDVSQNGDVSGFDASLVLKYLVGTEDLDYSQLLAAEVTQDGTISALDATAIAQYVVEIIDSLPVTNSDQLSGNGEFYFDELEFNPGSSMQIPINLINGDNLLSFEMECEYDPDALTIETIDWSNLISHFSIENNNTVGNFKVAGMGTSPDGEEGVFGILNIQVNPNFNDPQTIVNVAYRINESEYVDNMTVVINNSSLGVDSDAIPLAFNLYSNYPNPFNPTTSIKYDLPNKSMVNLTIYDVMGRKVMSLINDYKPAGSHSVQWNATNYLGEHVSAGMYIYIIQADDYRQVKKMILLK